METPKKPVKKTTAPKDTAADKDDEQSTDMPAKKKVIDDDDDEDFDMPLDDIGRYESFEGYDEEDDF
ncbi:hypothetical protein ACPPVU_10885 [Mucilaginibacter sp. McL0603]|uniref:hypothetical protein n=1 Tax=Mucilaginibacter sp. McL0603 TaxID=3415670 RepID=UPI003CF90B70